MEADFAAAYPALYRSHWWWRVREEILLRTIRRILAHVPNARILDVGCGAGLFFDALQEYGQVTGIEADARTIEESGRWRSRITLGQLDDAYQPTSPFDLILILDVLEHVQDPDRLLRRAAQILTPTGCVLITVPAFNWLWTTHDDLNHHRRRYSARGVRKTVHNAGLVTLETSYLFQSLVILKLLVRVREALAPRPPHVPQVPPPALNRAARAWFRTEYEVAGWLPFGGSLMAIAALANRSGAR
jgi:SAM-dependent methyltransferase